MKDENKSKEQLVSELKKLRHRVSEFDMFEAEYKRTYKILEKSHDELEKRIEEQKKELVGINERLRIIVESAQSIRACSGIDEMGKLLLEEFARTMAAEGGSLYRVENNTLTLVHSLDSGHASDTIPLPPKSGSVLERALKKKEPILISDIAKEKNILKSGWDGYRDGSLIIFPISDEKGKVTTVISLHNKTSPPFVEQDKEIGLILASYSCEFLRTIKNTQALTESEKLLQNILSASSVGIAYAKERKVAWANEAMEKMFGFEYENEYLGQTTYQLYASDEEYQRVGKITYEGIEAGGGLIETDAQLKRKDGSVFDGNVRVSVVDPSNPMRGIVVSIIDITDRKRAEEELRESEDKFSNIFRFAPVLFAITKLKDGEYYDVNETFLSVTGYSREEVIDHTSTELNLYAQGDRERLKQLLEKEGSFYNEEFDVRIKSGATINTLFSAQIINIAGEQCIISVAEDITDRKRAEEALKESEELFRTFIQTAASVILCLSLEGKITEFNKEAELLYGYKREDVIGKDYFELFIPKEIRKEIEADIKKVIKGEPTRGFENIIIRHDSSECVLSWNVNRILNPLGKTSGLIAVGHDITDRKRAEEALKGSEERFKSLSDASFEAIFVSEKGVCIDQNKTAEKMFGFTASEAVGRQGIEWIAPEDREEVMSNMLSGYEEPYEVKALRKNGTTFPAEIQARMAYFQNRQVRVTALNDITKRKKTEEALRTSEEKYRTILDNIDSGYFEVDIAGNYTFFNDSMCRILGYSKNEMLGKNNRNYMDKETAKDVYKVFNEVVRTKKTKKLFDWELIRKDKSRAFVSTSVTPIIDSSEKVVGFRGIARDITDRKRAEEALIASERNYREIFNATNEAIFIHDTETGDILDVNQTTCIMLGYTREEILKLNIGDLSFGEAPYVMEYVKKWIKKAKEEGSQLFEWYAKRKNGELFWVETNLKRSIIGGKDSILAVVRDITDRKQAEEALQERESQLSNILSSSAVGIGYTVNRKVQWANEAVSNMFGFEDEKDYVGKDTRMLYPSDEEYERVGKAIYERLKAGKDAATDTMFVRKDGSVFDGHIQIGAPDPSKPMIGTIISIIDITERKKAEEALRESEERLAEAQRIAHIGSWDYDPINDTFYWSDEMYWIFNQTPESFALTIDGIIGLIHPEDQKAIRNIAAEIVNKRQEKFTSEYRIINPDETIRYVTSFGNVIYDRKGTPLKVSGVTQDITERKRLEDQFIRVQKMESLGTLTGGIAHDFNNILVTILGYASYLKGKVNKEDPFYERLNVIEKSAIRASDLTSQLLAYTRMGKLEVRPINLNWVVEEVYALISKTFDKSIKIKLKTESNLKTVEGDRSQLGQIVMNIAVNAQIAMPKGGIFKIETYMEKVEEKRENGLFDFEPGNYVCMKFTDTGKGMDEETLKRIFEPYFTTRDDMGGSGLGMSVVFGIIKGHDGHINVESEPGKGSEIIVYLPASTKKEEILEKEIGEILGGTETVLIIDDEKSFLEMGKDILEESDYNVYTAGSGRTGLKTFKEKDIDIVILDIKMPEMDGEKVLKKMLEINPEVKVILSSGYSEENQHSRLIEMGAKGFVGKPFVIDKLLRKIREVLS